MSQNITIRGAWRSDIEVLIELNAQVQSLHHLEMPQFFKSSPSAQIVRGFFHNLFGDGANKILLALAGEAPVGYVYFELRKKPETAFTYATSSVIVHHLSVKQDYRRHGVGRALMDAVETTGGRLGAEFIKLDFWTFNDDARQFY